MAVTLKQIAEQAGVSISTVSRILNSRETGVPIREETRKRVMLVANELGYKPNLLARGLVGGTSSLIGVIVRDISDPFLNKVLKGMYDAAVERQYRLFLGHVGQHTDTTLDYGSMFEQSHADGIIIMGDMRGDAVPLEKLTQQHNYVVGVTDRTERRTFPGVYADSLQGALLAMEHLFQLGHKHIICVTDPIISDGRLRATVYEQQMREYGLEKYLQVYNIARSVSNGYKIGLEILAKHRDVTALFATTDTLALGIMKAAFESGMRMPSDLSIVGYDDIDMAPYAMPALTTVNQFGQEMGYKTTNLLLDMMQNKVNSDDVDDIILTPELTIRQSTTISKRET